MNHVVVDARRYTYRYSADQPAVASIRPGEPLTVQTLDASTNRTVEDGDVTSIPVDQVNPATGPIAIQGAQPGDILKVTIRAIRLNGLSHIKLVPGLGVCADHVRSPATRVFRLRSDTISFTANVNIPVRPMVGVIATAPAEGPIATVYGGLFGGNLDNKLLTPGAILYLPVFHKDALLFVGDLHASMGDGELCGLGIEASGEVDLVADIVHRQGPGFPVGERGETLFVCGYFEDLHEAIEGVSWMFVQLMMSRFGMSAEEGTMLLSAAADLRLSQCAPNCGGVAARVEIAREVLGMDGGDALYG